MPGETPITTRTLVQRAQNGDREAVEELFARSYGDLVQAARFRIGPALRARMDTIDIAQAAYQDAFRDLGQYEYRGKGSFRRWLLGIVENKIRHAVEYHRAKRRDLAREVGLRKAEVLPADATTVTRKLVEFEERERLERAMDQLREIDREVIVCHYWLGMSWREVGEHLNRSEEASQMLCRRALGRLKKLYDAT